MNNRGIDINILEAYLNGTLDPKSMHEVEKEALEDPFIAEALEGLSHSTAYAQNLSLLQKQLHERIAEQKISKKANVATWQRLSIAAAAAVVFISVGLMFLMRQSTPSGQKQAGNKAVEVTLTPREVDSAVASSVIAAAPEDKIAEAKAVAAAPAVQVVVPKKAEREISAAITESNHAALAKNVLKSQPTEEVIMNTVSAKRAHAPTERAEPVALQSRMADISVPVSQGRMMSPKDGKTPLSDPIVKPTLGNNVETLEYAQDVKAASAHSLSAALRDNGNTLNEIVVSNYNKFAPAKSAPVPTVDNEAYTRYLNKNNKLYTGADNSRYVELSFSVSRSGKPENIKVLKGLDQKYNEEAIRLLTDGPKWILKKKGSNKAALKVYF